MKKSSENNFIEAAKEGFDALEKYMIDSRGWDKLNIDDIHRDLQGGRSPLRRQDFINIRRSVDRYI